MKLIVLAMFCSVLSFGEIKHVRDEIAFDQTAEGNEIVILDVYADWCGPCQKLAPKLVDLDQEFSNKPGYLQVIKVDSDNSDDAWLNGKLKIKYLPTVIKFKKTRSGLYKEIDRKIGDMGYSVLKNWATK